MARNVKVPRIYINIKLGNSNSSVIHSNSEQKPTSDKKLDIFVKLYCGCEAGDELLQYDALHSLIVHLT